MKNFSRSALGLLLTSLCVSPAFAATPKPAAKPAVAHDVAPPAAGASAEIELVHTLGADKGEQLQKLVDRFNAKTTGPKIVIQDRPWNAGTLPHLMILGERDQQAFLSGATRYRPLHQVMKDAGIKMETLRAPAMMTPTPLDSTNRLVALPVGLSTPVMFYNKQAFKEAGLDTESAPPTWQALQGALGKLVAAGQSCPYTTAPAGLDPGREHQRLAQRTRDCREQEIHLPRHQRHARGEARGDAFVVGEGPVTCISSVVTTRLSNTSPRANVPCSPRPPAPGRPLKRQAGFEVGVAALPYHEEYYGAPQNTLADGPALWVGAGKKAADYKTIAKFIDHWLSAESQVEWQRNAGYLPLNRAGLLASESRLLAADLLNIHIGVKQLTNKPVTAVSRPSRYPQRAAVRRIIEEELESVWEDRKPSKLALDTAVARSRALD